MYAIGMYIVRQEIYTNILYVYMMNIPYQTYPKPCMFHSTTRTFPTFTGQEDDGPGVSQNMSQTHLTHTPTHMPTHKRIEDASTHRAIDT